MQFSFYKAEFVFNMDSLDKSNGLKTIKNKLIMSLSLYNSIHAESDMAMTLAYFIKEEKIVFFIRIPVELQEKTDFLNEFKRSVIEQPIWAFEKENKEAKPEIEAITQIKYFRETDIEDCRRALQSALEENGALFEETDMYEFLDIREEEELNEEKSELDELLDDELEGIFDNLDIEEDNQKEETVKSTDYFKSLVGLKEFKKEMHAISRFAEVNRRIKPRSGMKRIFPFHYVFTMEPGMGITTILKYFADHLTRCGIIERTTFIEYEGSLSFSGNENNGNVPNIFTKASDGSYKVDNDYGVIAVNISEQLCDPYFKFDRFMDILWEARGKVVFVLIINGGDSKEDRRLLSRIKSRINCHHINFPPFTDEEYVEIAEKMLGVYGLDMDEHAKRELLERINYERDNGSFENLRSLQKLIEEVRVEKHFNFSGNKEEDYDTISPEDFEAVFVEGKNMSSTSAWRELEDMVGLDVIKRKLKEIVANAKVHRRRRELGLTQEDASYHMIFTGNPGTGKTTAARILGRMFKEIGILKRGEVHEVLRDQLVGKYVGHTAPLVRQCVREALGSVLFIDEAYSLYRNGDDKRDFGHEAVEMLLREMEDKRDELIVIMAGYTKEMQEFRKMNPGLSQRIPYTIEFPDYNEKELFEIFTKLLGKDYVLLPGVEEKIKDIFARALKNAGDNFANGRFARNVAERLRMKQSMRLCEGNDFDREDLLTIKLEDALALYEDEDIRKSIYKTEKETGRIGFRVEL